MTYAIASALQAAVYGRLITDAALGALVGAAIYDEVPPGVLPSLYVSLGPETVRDRSDQTGRGAEHEFTVAVVTDLAGFATAKSTAGAVSDALIDAPLQLARGSLVSLYFHRASAQRSAGTDQREIRLIFRARVEDD
jgi:hypothetical protein